MKYYQFRKFGVSIDKPSEVKIDEKIKPEPEVKEPGRADYEWSFYICDNDPDLPEMRILRSGRILVRKVKLDTESRYKIGFDKDLKRCRLIMSPQGQAPRASSLLPSYQIFVQQKHFEKVQSMITLPAIYRLNPDTLIGELVSITTER